MDSFPLGSVARQARASTWIELAHAIRAAFGLTGVTLTLDLLLDPFITSPTEQHLRRAVRELVFGVGVWVKFEDGVLHGELDGECRSAASHKKPLRPTL